MTEKEFLEKRMPFWLTNEELHITMPSNMDKLNIHSHLCKKYGYSWMGAIRGYWWPKSHVVIYIGDYETPNVSVMVIQYLFSYFTDINYIGLGCDKGEVGEIWKPKLIVPRTIDLVKDDIRSL